MKKTILLISILYFGLPSFAQKRSPAQAKNGSQAQEWNAARNLFQAGNYKQAAVSYYQLSRKATDPKIRRQSKYFLGVSLYKMNLKQVASFPFVDLIRTGEGVEKQKALDYVVSIADELGEPSLLNYSLNHIRPDQLSDTSKAVFMNRLGEAALVSGDLKKAEAFLLKGLEFKKNENSLLYSLATVELVGKRPEEAVNHFSQLYQRLQSKPVTNLERGLALIGQARAYYQAKKWKEAIEIYRQITKDHPLYRQSLMELSWALFRSGQFRSALSPLQTLHTPFYENFYDPESLLLHSIILLFICHHEEIEPIMNSFDKNYYPAFQRIQEWVNSPRSDVDYYNEVVKTRKALAEIKKRGKSKTETELPFFVMRTLLEEPDVRILVEYVQKLSKEKKILEKVYGKTSLLAYGGRIVDGRKQAAQKQIGALIKQLLISKNSEFNDFATQFEFLKYEMINGQRTALKKKIAENPKGDLELEMNKSSQIDEDVSRDYYVQNGYRFWPFDGEYWRDEIGNYQYVGVNRCE